MIEAIPYDVLQESSIQEKLVDIDPNLKKSLLLWLYSHYQAIAWWLKFLILGVFEPLSQNEFEAFFNVNLESYFSIARLKWAISIYPRMPFLVEEFASFLELWYMLEYSHFIKWIQLTGMTGSPTVNKKGKLLGKAEGLGLSIKELNAYKKDFKQLHVGEMLPDDEVEDALDFPYEPDLTEVLLEKARHLVSESEGDDAELYTACIDFLDAQIQLQRSARKSRHSVYYLTSSNNLFISEKGIKPPKPNFQPKRRRGRPPKNSNIRMTL